MFDKELVSSILSEIEAALLKIQKRSAAANNASYFTDSVEGMEKLDGICMLFMAVGEGIKNIDKMTEGKLFEKYPSIDWEGVKGFRDIIAHHYFDIDAEQVFWIIKNELKPLSETISKILGDLR